MGSVSEATLVQFWNVVGMMFLSARDTSGLEDLEMLNKTMHPYFVIQIVKDTLINMSLNTASQGCPPASIGLVCH